MSVPQLLWWSLKLSPWTRQSPDSVTYDLVDVSELNPPPGYDPYTRTVNGSPGPFLTQEGAVLYASPFIGKKVNMVFTRAGEDVATIGYHVINLTNNAPDDTWVAADYDAVHARFLALWTALKPNYPPATHPEAYALSRISFYDFGAGVGRPNPIARDYADNVAGAGAAGGVLLPPQVAVSVTLKTTVRKSWGRVYWPAPLAAVMDTNGRLVLSQVTLFRDAHSALLDGLAADGFPLVVWRAREGGGLLQTHVGSDGKRHTDLPDNTSSALTVDTVQVDDVLDVIRSRRYDHAINKLSHTRA